MTFYGTNVRVSFVLKVTNIKENLPFESCFKDMEYKLMRQCCEFQRVQRPKLSQVKAKLQEMHENAGTICLGLELT